MNDVNKSGSGELWLSVVRRIIGKPTEGLSLLDLCCNECTTTARFKWKRHCGVDVVSWPKRPKWVEFHLKDAKQFAFECDFEEFDVCIVSDGVEHFTKFEGQQMLDAATGAARLVIMFTPLGEYMVDPSSTHPDSHKSGWWPQEFVDNGWAVDVYPKWHPSLGVGAFFAWKGSV